MNKVKLRSAAIINQLKEMTVRATKTEKPNVPHIGNPAGIENHKKAARHHEEAAKHHHEAVKHHQEGNHEKAYVSTVKAQGHHYLASKSQKKDIKYHALND